MKKIKSAHAALLACAMLCPPAWSQDLPRLIDWGDLRFSDTQKAVLMTFAFAGITTKALSVAFDSKWQKPKGELTENGAMFKAVICNSIPGITNVVGAMVTGNAATRRAADINWTGTGFTAELVGLLAAGTVGLNIIQYVCNNMANQVLINTGRTELSIDNTNSISEIADRLSGTIRFAYTEHARLRDVFNNPRANLFDRQDAKDRLDKANSLASNFKITQDKIMLAAGEAIKRSNLAHINDQEVNDWLDNPSRGFIPAEPVVSSLRRLDHTKASESAVNTARRYAEALVSMQATLRQVYQMAPVTVQDRPAPGMFELTVRL